MKRTDFLKSIIGGFTVVTLPIISKSNNIEKEYQFDDIFEQPYNNDILFYPKKDCKLYTMIKEIVGIDRILDHTHHGPYLGYHYNVLPIKESYTIEDFKPFAMALNSHYSKHHYYSEMDRGVFFRMIKEKDNTMYFDTFLGYSNGKSQYGSYK